MAEDSPKKRVVFLGDFDKISDELKESLAPFSQLSKLNIPVRPIRDPVAIPPHPSVRTTAEVKELNRKTDILIQAMLDLIAVTRDEAESMKASNRLIVRLGLATVFLTALVVVLTLLLVLR